MKQLLPVVITFFVGLFMLTEIFFDAPGVKLVKEYVTDFALALVAFTYVLMLVDVTKRELPKLRRRAKHPDWPYSAVMLAGLYVMLGFGIAGGKQHPVFKWIFDYVYDPLQSTMFALLAFYIASAAFRAFRARTLEAGILLGAALLVMFGRVPVGEWVSPVFVSIEEWIMNVPNLAAKRAIMLGAAIGAIATALRVILGLERDFLGGDE
jgi:hypothetical protein